MKKQELKAKLLEKLAILLKPYGFVLVRRMDWFIKKGQTSQIYQLAFYNLGDPYTIAPAIAIRIDEVERIFHLVSGFELQYQKDTPTINPTIQDLQKAKSGYEYVLRTPEHIEPMANELFKVFTDIALPFMEKNCTISTIDSLLNDSPEKEVIYYTSYLRWYHGAIVAKLNKRENFREVTETYRKFIAKQADYYLADYEKLLEILESL
jgi:hypothetical protein